MPPGFNRFVPLQPRVGGRQGAQILMLCVPGVLFPRCVQPVLLLWVCSGLLEGSPWVCVSHPFWQKSWKEAVFTFTSTLFKRTLGKQTHTEPQQQNACKYFQKALA